MRGWACDETVVMLGSIGCFVVTRDATLCSAGGREIPLSVSPSGRFAVFAGPRSSKSEEGRVLLQICGGEKDAGQLPLVRYTGRMPARIEFTQDETRFAFLTRRDRDHPRRLFVVRMGERHARAVSLPDQEPSGFGWVRPGLTA